MKEQTIEKVAKVLEEWNPLGENAKKIKDLNGYRVEAIDILSSTGLMPRNNIEKTISDVLEQAFNIKPIEADVKLAAKRIKRILDN